MKAGCLKSEFKLVAINIPEEVSLRGSQSHEHGHRTKLNMNRNGPAEGASPWRVDVLDMGATTWTSCRKATATLLRGGYDDAGSCGNGGTGDRGGREAGHQGAEDARRAQSIGPRDTSSFKYGSGRTSQVELVAYSNSSWATARARWAMGILIR